MSSDKTGKTRRPSGCSRIKRFFKTVDIEKDGDLHLLALDGRPAKTPTGAPLASSSRSLMNAVADEWRGDSEMIDLANAPLTRLLTAAIDLGADGRAELIGQMIAFVKSDHISYYAEKPPALVARQEAAWEPFTRWLRDELNIDLKSTAGVVFVEQDDATVDRVRELFLTARAEELIALRTITEMTGSAALGLAAWKSSFTPEDIFAASRVDEVYQREQWGEDAEAMAREGRIRSEFDAACRFLALTGA